MALRCFYWVTRMIYKQYFLRSVDPQKKQSIVKTLSEPDGEEPLYC
jgi:hypothetical protein